MSKLIFSVVLILAFIWIAYEVWRAPLMEDTEDGGLRTIRPTKKLSDLFKNKKNNSGSYEDLEKLGRGRSKH